MKKAAQKAAPKNKITDFFASSKSPKKPADGKMDLEPEPENNEPKKTITNPSELPPFDDFVSELYSWKPKLKSYTDSSKFKNVYSFIKKEYETKTV